MTVALPFDNTYARLPQRFFQRTAPTAVAAPLLVRLNRPLAAELGLDADWLEGPDGLAMLSGNRLPEAAEPIAAVYAGHQFGSFTPQLGDGRAILLGEVVDRQGQRRDIQLKGAGPTPYSRRGDGRAALGPVLREYVVSEAMHRLSIPTTRALAAVSTGEPVYRETALPGAVLARVAASHIRVGTFQFFAARGDTEAVRVLADHAVARHYPDLVGVENPYLGFLDALVSRQAALVAAWLGVGFIHGVMNTDNTSVSGETIDYGPCAFMDEYHPGTVFSSIDAGGRYAYANQPRIAQWNMARLAETLLPLLHENEAEALKLAEAAIAAFRPRFEAAYLDILRRKLGLFTAREEDQPLAEGLLGLMAEARTDFTLAFRALGEAAGGDAAAERGLAALFEKTPGFAAWAERWRERCALEVEPPAARRAAMRAVNPLFIPRNHLIEAAIAAAVERADFAPFAELLDVLERPFSEQPGRERFALPPRPDERVLQTFCGT
jgi:serine/tyrosine/threonine adenylyltransferase